MRRNNFQAAAKALGTLPATKAASKTRFPHAPQHMMAPKKRKSKMAGDNGARLLSVKIVKNDSQSKAGANRMRKNQQLAAKCTVPLRAKLKKPLIAAFRSAQKLFKRGRSPSLLGEVLAPT